MTRRLPPPASPTRLIRAEVAIAVLALGVAIGLAVRGHVALALLPAALSAAAIAAALIHLATPGDVR